MVIDNWTAPPCSNNTVRTDVDGWFGADSAPQDTFTRSCIWLIHREQSAFTSLYMSTWALMDDDELEVFMI